MGACSLCLGHYEEREVREGGSCCFHHFRSAFAPFVVLFFLREGMELPLPATTRGRLGTAIPTRLITLPRSTGIRSRYE